MEIHRLNALDAENAVAGSILIDPRAFAIASDILDSFQSELCRCIFRAAQSLSMAGQPMKTGGIFTGFSCSWFTTMLQYPRTIDRKKEKT